MPATTVKLGPGTLTIGETGTPVDFTCQVIGARVDWSVDASDPVQVLCGESVAGDRTYTAALSGTLFQDLGLVGGIVEYSWAHKGEEVPFSFVPSDIAAQEVSGTLTPDPLSVGGDETGVAMQSDFEWAIVGEPVLAAVGVVGAEAAAAAPAPNGKESRATADATV